MLKMINRLAIIDILFMITGLYILFVKPFGWDMPIAIAILAFAFVSSIVLFLVKLKLTSGNA